MNRALKAYWTFYANYKRALRDFQRDRDFAHTFPVPSLRMVQTANVTTRGTPLPEENPFL